MWVHDSLNNRFHRLWSHPKIVRSINSSPTQTHQLHHINVHRYCRSLKDVVKFENNNISRVNTWRRRIFQAPSLTTTMSLCRRLRMSLKNDDDSFFGIFMTKTPLKISLPHQISVRSSRVFISSNYQSSSSTSRADNGLRLPNCKVVLPKWV